MSGPCVYLAGTPEFAQTILNGLAATKFKPQMVITQPDRPAGRGRQLTASPVADTASELEIETIKPERIDDIINDYPKPDILIVAAFGQILRPAALAWSKHGAINVHASMLPKHRGAAPVAAAIRSGDTITGVSLMQMDEGVDTGPVLAQQEVAIADQDTTGILTDKLAKAGSELLVTSLPAILDGSLIATPQDETQASHTELLSRSDGAAIPWDSPATVDRFVRAMQPWPGASAAVGAAGIPIRILGVSAAKGGPQLAPGIFDAYDGTLLAGTMAGPVVIEKLVPAGKRAMTGAEFVRGHRI